MAAKDKAALASAYQELGKELLASSQLKTVGNYTLGRPIAEGTFGKVRLGTHRLTNTRVAIKQIPKTHNSHAAASLTREIHHHRRLHHPHVIQLYEVLATESSIWMVSELCAGGELYDYLVERGSLPEAEARRLFGQLCLAVAYIHERGIVHRDLKLENVLLDETCNVKLGDFGFTREFERRRLMDTFCGTTGYAAPEMLAGKKYTGQEVDIWSLGIILFALLTGSLPFDDDDEDVMRLKILQGDFQIPEDLSEDAQDLVRNILKQNPHERLAVRAILSHPWFTRAATAPPLLPTTSFGATSSASADDQHSPSVLRHAGPSETSALDCSPDTVRERDSDHRDGERARPASRIASASKFDLPPTLEADGDSIGTASLRTSADQIVQGADTSELISPVTMSTDPTAQTADLARELSESAHGQHGSTLSALSELSFVSAASEAESTSAAPSSTEESDSMRSQSTSQTTDEDEERVLPEPVPLKASPGEIAKEPTGTSLDASGRGLTGAIEGEGEAADRLRLEHLRNESQTTLRRKDSLGSSSDQSRRTPAGTTIGTTAAAASNPLPTHHELPLSNAEEGEAGLQAASAPSEAVDSDMPESGKLPTAAGGTGSGQFRTPSRSKRRSASSIALSAEGIAAPAMATLPARPVDYVSQLTQLQPPLFSTTVEQRLLVQLSMMGLDVGQIVHSVTTDACDASGGIWWLLKKKAEERERDLENQRLLSANKSEDVPESHASHAAAPGAHVTSSSNERPSSPSLQEHPSTATDPPPIPPKDPSRPRQRNAGSRAFVAGLPTDPRANGTEGLPKTAQNSFREQLSRLPGNNGAAAMMALRQLERDGHQFAGSSSSPSIAASLLPASSSYPGIDSQKWDSAQRTTGHVSGAAADPTPTPPTVATQSPLKERVAQALDAEVPQDSNLPSASAVVSTAPKASPLKTSKSKHGDRQRTNSLSIRTFTSALTGKSLENLEEAGSGPDGRLPERAKSPVSALFSRRGPGSLIGKAGGGNKGRDSGKGTANTTVSANASPSHDKVPRPDPFLSSALSKQSPSPSQATLQPAISSGELKRSEAQSAPKEGPSNNSPIKDKSKAVKEGDLRATVSHDTFSTVRSQPEVADEQQRGVEKARRSKSSFLSTVRTWLKPEERQAKKRSRKQAAAAAHHLASQHAPSLRGSSAALGGTHSRNNSASLSGSAARGGSIRARQNPYPPVSPTTRRSLIGPPSAINNLNRGSTSRRSSTGSTVIPGIAATLTPATSATGNIATVTSEVGNRPTNPRRQSAGSLTPTGTAYGDAQDSSGTLFGAPSRGSRPSSMHSFSQLPSRPRRLPAKSGSMSSAGSLRKPYNIATEKSGSNPGSFNAGSLNDNSLKSLHARRLSADGGTVVRRQKSGYGLGVKVIHGRHHRTGSGQSRASSPGPSMLGEIARAAEETPDGGHVSGQSLPRARTASGVRSARNSAQEGDLLTVPGATAESGQDASEAAKTETSRKALSSNGSFNAGSGPAPSHHPTLFVAHKSRSPYRPPSANHALQGMIHRAAATGHAHQQHTSAGPGGSLQSSDKSLTSIWEPRNIPLGTWHRSWGRPPPGWTGPVDDSPVPPKRVSASQSSVLRDVFSRPSRTFADVDDEWVDEDEEPAYSGGLGQLDSSKASAAASSTTFTPFSSAATTSSGAFNPLLPGARSLRQIEGLQPYTGSGFSGMSESIHARSEAFESRGFKSAFSRTAAPGFFAAARQNGSALRGLFTPPALGSEMFPRTTVIEEPTKPAGGDPAPGSQVNFEGTRGPSSSSTNSPATEGPSHPNAQASVTSTGSGVDGAPGSCAGISTPTLTGPRRAAPAATSAFLSIEEGEEEED